MKNKGLLLRKGTTPAGYIDVKERDSAFDFQRSISFK